MALESIFAGFFQKSAKFSALPGQGKRKKCGKTRKNSPGRKNKSLKINKIDVFKKKFKKICSMVCA
jgi:hypothetical protein